MQKKISPRLFIEGLSAEAETHTWPPDAEELTQFEKDPRCWENIEGGGKGE